MERNRQHPTSRRSTQHVSFEVPCTHLAIMCCGSQMSPNKGQGSSILKDVWGRPPGVSFPQEWHASTADALAYGCTCTFPDAARPYRRYATTLGRSVILFLHYPVECAPAGTFATDALQTPSLPMQQVVNRRSHNIASTWTLPSDTSCNIGV